MPAITDEELSPELALKVDDLLGQRRAGNVEPLCGSTEMQLLGDSDKVGELPEFHGLIVRRNDRWEAGLPVLGYKSWTADVYSG
ncbi:hypothetical protein AHiyo8_06650 [Arthrobacter sp. Hiyo8]|nr:hypothetical protein AHiyo8_06650 [Arthrobacter sp. Hiyo8]